MTITVGIDPGVSGALAWVRDGELLAVHDMPAIDRLVNAPLLARLIDELPADRAAIEALHAMPKMNPTALFKLGQAHGICLGVTAHLPQIPARPQTWKKHFRIVGDRRRQKEQARGAAIDLWPDWADSFRRVKDADRAEASLIALWAEQKEQP